MTLLESALAYAARGLHVFPCFEITLDGTDCACRAPIRAETRTGTAGHRASIRARRTA
jgi:hypothetical protein